MNEVPRYPKPEAVLQMPQYGHVVIEASAGTGKTYTIEHWILDLLMSRGLSIKEILILTFTVKGASELRSRLRARIRHLLSLEMTSSLLPPEQCFCLDAQARSRLMAALADFDDAPIYTIHGFCHAVIGEYAFALRRPLKQTDGQMADERMLFGRAFRQVLRSDLATSEGSESILTAWLQAKGSRVEALENLLFECHRVGGKLGPTFDANRLRAAVQSLPDLEAIDGRLGEIVPKISLAKVTRTIRALRAALEESSPFSILGRLESIDLPYLADRVEPLREPLARLQASAVSLSAVVAGAFLPKVKSRLRAMKCELEVVGYEDMLSLVAEALEGEDSEELKPDLRSRYRVAIVDEFQDTDRVQWQILRALFFEGGGANPLCLVGDPKQAIYGFRGADVHAYLDAKRAVVARSAVVPLVECFRSTQALIQVLNRIFDQKIESPFFTGNVRYDRPVRPGNSDLHLVDSDGEALKPLVLMRPSWDSARHTQADARNVLVEGIAREIRELSVKPFRFGERGKERSLDLSDVYVLTRTNEEAREVGEALAELAIPYVHLKQEGLFSTREAEHVLDLLRALEDPGNASRRFRAWMTPFFGISLRDVESCADLSPDHPLMSRLMEWRDLAASRDYTTLVPRILESSGLTRRLLIREGGERPLTNYRHLFEILLEEAHRTRATLSELIRNLEASVETSRLSSENDHVLQRLASDAPAVRVLTMHMAKGLEAAVVFLYAMSKARVPRVHVHHEGGTRLGFIGRLREADDATRAAIGRENEEEDQRLLYVALTRARGRLYLPLLPPELAHGRFYAPLNQRLEALQGESDSAVVKELLPEESTVLQEAAGSLREWRPPDDLFSPPVHDFDTLKERHRGQSITSYSRLKALSGGYTPPRSFAGPDPPRSTLAGGKASGIFLHEVLQAVELGTLAQERDFETWRRREDVRKLFRYYMRRNGIENRFASEAQRLVYVALTTPISLGSARLDRGLVEASRCLRELEFLYPYPEELDRLDRGFVKGYIDLLFEHEGLLYIVDWKSDSLDTWGAEAVRQHVENNYRLQGRLYALAALKMVGVEGEGGYEGSFGGVLYCFIRGMPDGGIHFERPSWAEMQAFRDELIQRDRL